MRFSINVRQVIHSLSEALDLVGIDEVNHGKRVAFMAVACGKAMQLSTEQLDTIHHASLLHDCGVSSTQVHRKLVTELDWSGAQEHCTRGKELLARCHLFDGLPPIIYYHHTHWEDLPSHLDPDLALISNLIYLTDRVDALIAQHGGADILMARHPICDTIKKYRDFLFKPELVDIFLKLATREFFWLSLDTKHLTSYLMDMERQTDEEPVDAHMLLEVATIFADIVDAKSTFTVEHSRGVARLAKFLGSLLGYSEDVLYMLEAAGLLHDLGKLNVPDEILDKPGPLTDSEMAIMMRHSFESYQILHRIKGFEKITQWAAFHHEGMSGAGYPFHKTPNSLSTEARIIAVADVFQALAQKRPYRESLTPEKIIITMTDMAKKGKLDPKLVALAGTHVEKCWRYAQCLD